MVYAATLSEYQRVVRWRFILEEFGPNMQHISGAENKVADMISIFSYTSVDKYNPRTKKAQCFVNKLFAISREEKNEDCFPLNILNVQREQQKDLRKVHSKLIAYISG